MQLSKLFQSKLLILFTSSFLLFFILFLIFYDKTTALDPIPLYTTGQPSIGKSNAKVHIVTFEDPKCNQCILFHREVYRTLYDRFISKGDVYYTVYLVGGLPLSGDIISTLLCIYQTAPQQFFPLLDDYYTNPTLGLTKEAVQKELLLKLSRIDPSLNLTPIKNCLKDETFDRQTQENTNYARAIMGGVIKTPTVFVNGRRITRPSLDELEEVILKELGK